MTHFRAALADFTGFAWHTVAGAWTQRGLWRAGVPVAFSVGVGSLAVVCVTGVFVGLVLAVQAYGQFHKFGLETALGSIVNTALVRELGPVLTGVMLAGRVGGAMAAELASMRVTDQIDALSCLGVHPVRYLSTPRFLACLLLIPFLTAAANFMGVAAGAAICLWGFDIDRYHYWMHAQKWVGPWEIFAGLGKSVFFGAALALISCHRGFRAGRGAVGVGRAATEAFVFSFVAILALDFIIALVLYQTGLMS